MVSVRIDVNAPDLDHIPTKMDTRFLGEEVKAAAGWVRSVWIAAVSGAVLPGMSGPVDDPEYARSLGMPSALKRSGQWEYTITARYDVAARIENGYGSYDMKPAFLNGPKSRPLKDGSGRWNVIPFRFGTPIPGKKNAGQSRANFPGDMTMPPEVYQIVRLGDRLPDSPWGQRTKIPFLFTQTDTAGVNREAVIRGIVGPMTDAYTWKAGLYSGMKRYGAKNHSQYLTFRAVSTTRRVAVRERRADGKIQVRMETRGSDPNSWIHPGMGANPVIQAVRDYTMPFVQKMLLNAVNTLR